MSCLSQVDVKDGVAVGTKSCRQHSQHPTVWKVGACIRERLNKFCFGNAWIGISFLKAI